MRRVEHHPAAGDKNAMQYWYRLVGPVKASFNFAIIFLCRYLPSLRLKNFLYRKLLGMHIGRDVSVGLMVMLDIFFPHLITIGDNSIIGYNTTILTHEFLVDEYRRGPVEIGKNVLIGANTTVLPGVKIGDGAVVGAASLVNRDIPPGVLAAGTPVKILKEKVKKDVHV
ncbi:acyltransferase [Desulfolucanica intricata]|uniref:acyltransferase n=1 Tax=Desulfolucanica intricata TaxID=1285191 RepID=UPI00082EE84B|nr:acyltransferase [Desulfolucanica intricata]